ncbi:hypothetical protein HDU86_006899 [Geranomyces michiganensis]|nr:hypothetical protein HDU86_006899 [Geranomyces michiganensis]
MWPSLEDGAADDEAWTLSSAPALSDETEPLGWLSDADLASFDPVDEQDGDADDEAWTLSSAPALSDETEPLSWLSDADLASFDPVDEEDGDADDEAWTLSSAPALSDETEPLGWLSDADLASFGPVDDGDAEWSVWFADECEHLSQCTEPEGWMSDPDDEGSEWFVDEDDHLSQCTEPDGWMSDAIDDIPIIGGDADWFQWISDTDEQLSQISEPEGWLSDADWSDCPTILVQVAANDDADVDGATVDTPSTDSWFLDVDGLEDDANSAPAPSSATASSSGDARNEIDRQLAEIFALASGQGSPIVPDPVDVEAAVDQDADVNGEGGEQAPLATLPLREILRLPPSESRTRALRERARCANRSGRSAAASSFYVWVVDRREEYPEGLDF